MFNTKAIKGFPYGKRKKERKNPNKLMKIIFIVLDFIKYRYWDVESFFSRYVERIKRSTAFAKMGWLNYDFDSAFLYVVMEFKLRRIEQSLKNGMGVQEKENMDPLKELIKIVGRLGNGNYDSKYHDIHNKKWGNIKTKHIPRDVDKNGKVTTWTWETSRKNVKTQEQEKQERKEFLMCFELGERDRLADLDRMNEILKKHAPTWWD